MKDDDVVILQPEFNGESFPVYTSVTSDVSRKRKVRVYKIPERVIPIVFLPGVMGSNLKSKENNSSIWRLDGNFSLFGWITKGAEDRKSLLDPNTTNVDSNGSFEKEINPEKSMFKSRRSRGWGEVGAMSYGEFLPWIQSVLNDNNELINNRITNKIKKTAREELINGIQSSAIKQFKLSSEEIALSYRYLYPVHAMGYNWLKSNEDSAQRLKSKIEEIIGEYIDSGYKCEKVILITHSMGGLVARYYSEVLGGRSRVLGVLHGVMPNKGSPMTYKRMKAGESGIVGAVIGSSGLEMTAVLAQSPGPLQLLPGSEYGNGWLKIEGMKTSLPRKNDPYTEIYLERNKWWGLCEERFLKVNDGRKIKVRDDKEWLEYFSLMNLSVMPFIEKLNNLYHPHTYSFYGCGGMKYPSYRDITWRDISYQLYPKSGDKMIAERGVIDFPKNTYNQTVRSVKSISVDGRNSYALFSISSPDSEGDGTVPTHSALINSKFLVSQIGLSVEHESAFKKQGGGDFDSCWYTLWSVLKISQNISETDLSYDE